MVRMLRLARLARAVRLMVPWAFEEVLGYRVFTARPDPSLSLGA